MLGGRRPWDGACSARPNPSSSRRGCRSARRHHRRKKRSSGDSHAAGGSPGSAGRRSSSSRSSTSGRQPRRHKKRSLGACLEGGNWSATAGRRHSSRPRSTFVRPRHQLRLSAACHTAGASSARLRRSSSRRPRHSRAVRRHRSRSWERCPQRLRRYGVWCGPHPAACRFRNRFHHGSTLRSPRGFSQHDCFSHSRCGRAAPLPSRSRRNVMSRESRAGLSRSRLRSSCDRPVPSNLRSSRAARSVDCPGHAQSRRRRLLRVRHGPQRRSRRDP